MADVSIQIEQFITPESYREEMGPDYSKALPYECVENLAVAIVSFLDAAYPQFYWCWERGKWANEINGYAKSEMSESIEQRVLSGLLSGRRLTVAEAKAWPVQED